MHVVCITFGPCQFQMGRTPGGGLELSPSSVIWLKLPSQAAARDTYLFIYLCINKNGTFAVCQGLLFSVFGNR